jgi:hypothetical protein
MKGNKQRIRHGYICKYNYNSLIIILIHKLVDTYYINIIL